MARLKRDSLCLQTRFQQFASRLRQQAKVGPLTLSPQKIIAIQLQASFFIKRVL